MLTERPDIEGIKRKNIIDMALGFTAMTRIFSVRSKAKIETQLEVFFTSLTEINTRDEYEARHRSFCEWFSQEIWTAERKLKNGRLQPSQLASYGQGAKVLDIAIKVYVYYCPQPTVEIAQRIAPLLNGAMDGPIIKVLKTSRYASDPIQATTIKEIDRGTEQTLQLVPDTSETGLCPTSVGMQGHVWPSRILPIETLEEALGKGYITVNPTLLPSDFMANGFRPLRSDSQSFTHHGKASGRLEYNGVVRTQWRTVTPRLESHSFSSIYQHSRPGVSRPQ